MGAPRSLLLLAAFWLATALAAMNTAARIAFIPGVRGSAAALLRTNKCMLGSDCYTGATRLLARSFAVKRSHPGERKPRKRKDVWDRIVAQLPNLTGDRRANDKRAVKGVADHDHSTHTGTHHSCPICAVKSQLLDVPVVARAKEVMKNRYRMPFEVVVGSQVFHWRTQAKLACQPLTRWGGGVEIGMYKEGTHELEPIYECMSHHQSINRITNVIRDACKELDVSGYNERTGEGSLRYLQMSVERNSGQVQLTLVWNAETMKQALQESSLLVKRLRTGPDRDLLHSIWLNQKPRESEGQSANVILRMDPSAWRHLYGTAQMEEQIGQATVALNPQVFRQANLELFDDIAREVVRQVPSHAKVCELYAGVGVLGFNLLLAKDKQVEFVRCSDSNPWLEDHFNASRSFLPEDLRAKVTFACQSAAEAIASGQAADCNVLIVDPPRKGLEAPVVRELCSTTKSSPLRSIRTLIYVSCGFDALERELAELTTHGWKLQAAKGYLMFPGSNHIETVAVLKR